MAYPIIATATGGTIIGLIALALLLLCCLIGFIFGICIAFDDGREGAAVMGGSAVCALLILGCWWWGMAFTTSDDYHSWNVKQGRVERVAKRLIATDNGMSERYVVTINGQPYGIDDTRATLVKPGDVVSLRCKKDFQWGVPRSAHGWACRWNGGAS